jgi:hypothetical protein
MEFHFLAAFYVSASFRVNSQVVTVRDKNQLTLLKISSRSLAEK